MLSKPNPPNPGQDPANSQSVEQTSGQSMESGSSSVKDLGNTSSIYFSPKDKEEITKLISEASAKRSSSPSKSTAVPSAALVENVCKDVLTELKYPINEENIRKVKCNIAVQAQLGATSPKFAETRTEDVFLPNCSIRILRSAAAKNKTTIRALARALR